MTEYVLNLDPELIYQRVLWSAQHQQEDFTGVEIDLTDEDALREHAEGIRSRAVAAIESIVLLELTELVALLRDTPEFALINNLVPADAYGKYGENPNFHAYLGFYAGCLASVSQRKDKYWLHTTSGDRIEVRNLNA
jgi:hypothetical protein